MKKHIYVVVSGFWLIASCSNDNNNSQLQLQQRIIDSTVNAKLAQREAQNAATNDSTLKALEKQKADSLEQLQQINTKEPVNKTSPSKGDSLNKSANQ